MKEIEVKVNLETGELTVEAIGFNGVGCKDATKFLEESLGTVTDVKKKAEWWILNGERNAEVKQKFGIDGSNLCG